MIWRIEDIISPEFSRMFIKSNQKTHNFGFTDSVYLFRFKLVDNSSHKDWLLVIDYPLIDNAFLYIPQVDTSFKVLNTGSIFPFSNRLVPHQNMIIPFSADHFKEKIYYLLIFPSGVLPSNVITKSSMYAGSILEVFILSLALADQIKIVRQEKEQAQAAAIQNLHIADKLKDEFLANTTHELKTPLNGIIGITEAMLIEADIRVFIEAFQVDPGLIRINIDYGYMKTYGATLKLAGKELDLWGGIFVALSDIAITQTRIKIWKL